MKRFTKGIASTSFGQLKLSKSFQASSLSTYDFSTFYTTLTITWLKKKELTSMNVQFLMRVHLFI